LAQKLADEVMGPNSLITLDLRELKTREVLEDKLLSAAVPTPTVSDKPSFANKVILIDHLEELEKLTDKKAQARILGFLSYLVHQDLSKGMDLSDTILFFNSNQPLKQLACMKTVEGDQFTNRLSGCNGLSLTYPSSKP
jgi:hypothetical protein